MRELISSPFQRAYAKGCSLPSFARENGTKNAPHCSTLCQKRTKHERNQHQEYETNPGPANVIKNLLAKQTTPPGSQITKRTRHSEALTSPRPASRSATTPRPKIRNQATGRPQMAQSGVSTSFRYTLWVVASRLRNRNVRLRESCEWPPSRPTREFIAVAAFGRQLRESDALRSPTPRQSSNLGIRFLVDAFARPQHLVAA